MTKPCCYKHHNYPMKKYQLKKGILIAIEGIDGAGKTTQVTMLREYYQRFSIPVTTLKEPTSGEFGQKIKQLAMHGRHKTAEEELELFINDRIEDCEKNIAPALKKNELVIMDRYYFSSVAYQGALGLDPEYILKRNEEVAIKPDIVIILDVAAKIGLSRIIYSRNDTQDHFENEEYLDKVREIFRRMSAPYVQLVDGHSDEDSVFRNTRNIVQDILNPHLIDIEKEHQLTLFKSAKGSGDLIFTKN